MKMIHRNHVRNVYLNVGIVTIAQYALYVRYLQFNFFMITIKNVLKVVLQVFTKILVFQLCAKPALIYLKIVRNVHEQVVLNAKKVLLF